LKKVLQLFICLSLLVGLSFKVEKPNEVSAKAQENKVLKMERKENVKKLKKMMKAGKTDAALPSDANLVIEINNKTKKISNPHAATMKLKRNGKNTYASLVGLSFEMKSDGLEIKDGKTKLKFNSKGNFENEDNYITSFHNKSDKNLFTKVKEFFVGKKAYAFTEGKEGADTRFGGDIRQYVYVEYDRSGTTVSLEYVEFHWERASTNYAIKDAEGAAICQWRTGSWDDYYTVGTISSWQSYNRSYDYGIPASCGYTDENSSIHTQVGYAQADFYQYQTRIYNDVRTEIKMTSASVPSP
jgi:hypothetical protein